MYETSLCKCSYFRYRVLEHSATQIFVTTSISEFDHCHTADVSMLCLSRSGAVIQHLLRIRHCISWHGYLQTYGGRD